MTSLPNASDFTDGTRTEAQMKAAFSDLRGYLAGLLGDDGLPATALASLGALGAGYVAKTGAYSVTTSDRGKVIACNGTFTLSLPPAATAGAGFSLLVRVGAGSITLDPDGAELIQSSATVVVGGRSCLLSCTGTGWAVLWMPRVQDSATDATADRVMAVGAFGLGATAVTPVTDYDALTVTGFYRNNATATGAPTTGLYWSVLHIAHAVDGTASQLALRSAGVAANEMWLRRKAGGNWSAWAKVFHSENLLGTVSQSAGVPTGAVIERGANANGEYVKFADGTLICTTSGRTLAYSTADLVTYTWTFPAPFVAGSYPVVSAALSPLPADYTGLSRRDLCAFGQSAGIAGSVASFTRPSGATRAFTTGDTAANVRLVVNGRWF